MMFKSLVAALTLSALYILQTQSTNLQLYPKNVQDEILKCRAKYNVTDAMIDNFDIPKESMCFFNCTAVVVGYMTPQGNTSLANFKKVYGSIIPVEYTVVLSKCVPKAVGKDACEVAYNWRKCLVDFANED